MYDIDHLDETKKLAYSMGAIAPIEELSKFLVFWFFVQRKHIKFSHPVDGLIYAAAAALGFATIENWYFMISVDELVWHRAITLPFNHVLFASFWGIALGISHCKGAGSRIVVVGIFLSIIYHGLYDYILFSDLVPNLSVAPLVLVLWLWLSLATRDLLAIDTAPRQA
jgi:RsiW-degrading membrane proteinase PrsW (M82 family)